MNVPGISTETRVSDWPSVGAHLADGLSSDVADFLYGFTGRVNDFTLRRAAKVIRSENNPAPVLDVLSHLVELIQDGDPVD